MTDRETIDDLRHILRVIANQKLFEEMTALEMVNADFDGGYDECVRQARTAFPNFKRTGT